MFVFLWAILEIPDFGKNIIMTPKDSAKNKKLSIPVGAINNQHLDISRQLEKVDSALTNISSTQNLQEIQNIATKEFVNIFSVMACSLSHWDKEEDVLTILSDHGPKYWGDNNIDDEKYFIKDYPLTEYVLKNNEIKHITDKTPGIDPGEKKLLEKFGVKSLLMIPLASQQNVFGLIELYDVKIREFEKNEILLIKLFSHHVAVALENAKLLSETLKGFNEQKALHESALIISTSLDLNTILSMIAEQVCKLIDATSVYISGFDPIKKSSIVLAEYFGPDASIKERISDVGFIYDNSSDYSALIKSIQAGEPEIYHIDDPDLDDADREYLEKFGGISVLDIPLKSGGEFNAFIEVWETRHRREFTKNEIILCETIASQAAIAINNATLFNKAQEEIQYSNKTEEINKRQLNFISALRDIDTAITSSLDLDLTLKILLEHTLAQLEVDAVVLFLLDKNLNLLSYKAGTGFKNLNDIQNASIRLGDSFAGQVALERKLLISDFKKEIPSANFSKIIRGEQFVSYAGAPLVAKGRILGVLEVYKRTNLEPDVEWVRFFETLAGQAAIAIDNILLFNELRRSNLELSLGYDQTIEGWAKTLEMRDDETKGHSQRVTDITIEIAKQMGLKAEDLIYLKWGALLHDIGKMNIPDKILLKEDQLDEEEWEIMRKHPQYAYDFLSEIKFLKPALDIPLYHHERWDGSGYPNGLKGEAKSH